MGTLGGFVVGYVLGAKTGPQAFDKLGQAWEAVSSSKEFKALVAAAFEEGHDLAEKLKEVADERGELRAALQVISESPEFKALVGGATTVATGVLGKGMELLGGRSNGVEHRS